MFSSLNNYLTENYRNKIFHSVPKNITTQINGEECKSAPGFSRYVVSETGRIYRIAASTNKEKELLESKNGKNYVRESKVQFYGERIRGRWTQVGLIKDNGKFSTASAEKLICDAFNLWPKGKGNYAIDLKDGNCMNINRSNLVITEQKPRNSKLSKEEVTEIKKLIDKETPLAHIAKTYGVSDMQICRIKSGENWRKGGRVNPAPTIPFHIDNGKIRRLLASFEYTKIDNDIRGHFNIKRSEDKIENKISGVINGFRFTKTHQNISRARKMVYKLNTHFFGEEIAIKAAQKELSKQVNLQTIEI